jgi:hypothetical protein
VAAKFPATRRTLQFSISGSFSGCTLVHFTEDSAHVYDDGHPMSPGSHGTGPVGCHPTVAGLSAAQVGSVPKTVMVPFTDLVGFPDTPLDKTKITGFWWAFIVDPRDGQGTTSCVADLTIDDLRFY